MSNLFNFGDVRNHPRRSGFDLSRRICFTSKCGELLPVYWKLVYPGDKFNIRTQLFTRTQPVNTAAYTRIREYIDWYFVPLRLINKNFPAAIMQMQKNPVQAESLMKSRQIPEELPWCTLYHSFENGVHYDNFSSIFYYLNSDSQGSAYLNFFGFRVGTLAAKLLMYLRYGNFVEPAYTPVPDESDLGRNLSLGLSSSPDFDLRCQSNRAVHLLPFFAYQKIYADFFRFSQWENNEPFTYNIDWYQGGNFFASLNESNFVEFATSNNLFTMRYANWNKDMFMGVLPSSQLGEVSVVNVSNVDNNSTFASLKLFPNPVGSVPGRDVSALVGQAQPGQPNPVELYGPAGSDDYSDNSIGIQVSDLKASFSILQLRMAEAVQRFREVSQCADQTARDQIYAHFGVSISPALSDKCRYLGGSVSNLDISEVVNNNLSGDNNANIQGKGVGSGQGSVSCQSDEYGILMAIYHNVPLLDYVITGQPKELSYTNVQDLPIPEFDSIGMESIDFGQFINEKGIKTNALQLSPMGYLPRYYELKTDYDEVYGAFRTTLKNWVAPLNPKDQAKWMESTIVPGVGQTFRLNYGFFKVNPRILDSIFNVKADDTVDTDPFLSALYFDVKPVRNFDYDGMPY